jgi:chromate reductase
MITIIAGTNRPHSNTFAVARLVRTMLVGRGEDVTLLDLAELPPEIFAGTSYAVKPIAFAPFQEAILETRGILTVVPEYNGSFPGVLKYFIDMLRFPESLYEQPAAFVGISSGRWGGIRAVEQLEMIFQYRHAHLFGRRVFIPGIGNAIGPSELLDEPEIAARLLSMVGEFARFCHRLDDREGEP